MFVLTIKHFAFKQGNIVQDGAHHKVIVWMVRVLAVVDISVNFAIRQFNAAQINSFLNSGLVCQLAQLPDNLEILSTNTVKIVIPLVQLAVFQSKIVLPVFQHCPCYKIHVI